MRKFGMSLAFAGLAITGLACSAESTGSNDGAQSSDPVTVADALRAGYARTPFGLAHPSCVHAVPDGAKIAKDGIHLRSGEIKQLAPCAHALIKTHGSTHAQTGHAGPSPEAQTPATYGWTAANWAHGSWGYIAANFTVPQTPANQGNQLLYFFPSLEPEAGDAIIQPVLQWGVGYAQGSGPFWAMASWSLYPQNQVFYSTLTAVNSGDTLVGTVQGNGTCSDGHCDTWTITTQDTSTGASTSLDSDAGGQSFHWANGGVLEQYGVTSCDQYPADGSITFSSVVVQDSNFSQVTPSWSNNVYSNISPQCNFSVSEPDANTVTIAY